MPVIIKSSTVLANLEEHCKVLAGPGAGKTQFLSHHIKNLLNRSKRLSTSRRIACITYTNVATEKILSRVGEHGGRLEISTIHSFLYKHLVKPYVHLVATSNNLAYEKVDGHDDIVLSGYSTVDEWKKKTGQIYLKDDDIRKVWGELRWKLKADKTLELSTPYPPRSGSYSFKSNSLIEYKKILWSKGLLHHDDVLYFSYELVTKFPFVLDVLRACFPYFLIDEFQDTSPIQIEILQRLAEKETIVTAIGDEAQSIYSFLGAEYGQLQKFTLPGIKEYTITDNWRSSNEILSMLAIPRADLKQTPQRNISTQPVTILVGDKLKCLQYVEAQHTGIKVVSLSRDNITANILQKKATTSGNIDLLSLLKSTDGNSDRRRMMTNSIKAIEYVKLGYIKDAIRTINKSYNYGKTTQDKKRALVTLMGLLENEHSFKTGKLIELYNYIVGAGFARLSAVRSGAPKEFYNNTAYADLTLAVKNLYEAGNHRTIHKSKGEEFECVLVVLDRDKKGKFDDSAALSFLLAPDMKEEEQRILYVAASRAKDYLYFTVPQLSAANSSVLTLKGISILPIP